MDRYKEAYADCDFKLYQIQYWNFQNLNLNLDYFDYRYSVLTKNISEL